MPDLPDWITPGAQVGLVTESNLGRTLTPKVVTVTRVLKTKIVLTEPSKRVTELRLSDWNAYSASTDQGVLWFSRSMGPYQYENSRLCETTNPWFLHVQAERRIVNAQRTVESKSGTLIRVNPGDTAALRQAARDLRGVLTGLLVEVDAFEALRGAQSAQEEPS